MKINLATLDNWKVIIGARVNANKICCSYHELMTIWQMAALKPKAGMAISRSTAERALVVRDLIPSFIVGAIVLVALAVAYVQAGGARSQFLVIAPLSWSQAATTNLVLAADGRLIRQSRFSDVMIVASNNANFPRALRSAGAWLVIPVPDAWGCSGSPIQGTRE